MNLGDDSDNGMQDKDGENGNNSQDDDDYEYGGEDDDEEGIMDNGIKNKTDP